MSWTLPVITVSCDADGCRDKITFTIYDELAGGGWGSDEYIYAELERRGWDTTGSRRNAICPECKVVSDGDTDE